MAGTGLKDGFEVWSRSAAAAQPVPPGPCAIGSAPRADGAGGAKGSDLLGVEPEELT